MNFKTTLIITLLSIFTLLCGYINGPATSVMASFTGAPFENGILCFNCHSEPNYGNITTEVEVFEQGTNIPVDSAWEGGKLYDIQLTVNHLTSVPIGYGFQCVVADQFGNQLGNFMAPQANTKLVTLPSGILVAEHNGLSPVNVFKWQWFTPVFFNASLNDAYFYSAGVAANGNGFPTGDGGSSVSGTLILEGPPPPFPIELISFTAKNIDNSYHLLKWSTASEQEADYFLIEHSTDGDVFRSLAQVQAAGNSIEQQDYSFRHTQPTEGTNYYRLTQADTDGSINQLKTVSVYQYQPLELVNIFPIPVVDQATLEIRYQESGSFQLELLDAAGQCLREKVIQLTKGTNSIPLNFSNLASGNYFVKLYGNNTMITGNVIKF